MEPIRITKDEAKRLVRKAYEAGELQAQAPREELPYMGQFKDQHGRCCAVGVVLPENHTVWEKDYLTVGQLIGAGFMLVDDRNWFRELQELHDLWLCARREGTPNAGIRHQMFAEHIGVGEV